MGWAHACSGTYGFYCIYLGFFFKKKNCNDISNSPVLNKRQVFFSICAIVVALRARRRFTNAHFYSDAFGFRTNCIFSVLQFVGNLIVA